MIELYKRHIWNDDKTVNVIATGGCLHDNPKIVAAACKFFLVMDYNDKDDSSDSSDEGGDKLADIKHRKGSKLTKKRQGKIDKAVKQF